MAETPPDLTTPAIRLAALGLIGAVTDELNRAMAALAIDGGEPDPAAFKAALARANVLLADLSRWAGAVE